MRNAWDLTISPRKSGSVLHAAGTAAESEARVQGRKAHHWMPGEIVDGWEAWRCVCGCGAESKQPAADGPEAPEQ